MRRHQLYFIVISLLAIAHVCVAQADGQSKPRAQKSRTRKPQVVASKIVGTWRLVSDEFRRPNGEVIPFPGLGPNVRGLLMYDATGYMAVHIVNMSRPNFAGVTNAACDDLRASLRGYRGYFGKYEVNETEGYIIHHVDASVFPNAAGQHWKRSYKLSGDHLVLEAAETANGEQGTALITWERVR